MAAQSSYLYGVMSAHGPRRFGPIGINGGEVRAVPYGELVMIAGAGERVRFGELPAEKTLQCLAEHQRVLERVMVDLTVIPLKFGTYADDDRQIVSILESGYRRFAAALKQYTGKIELDLVASWADLQAVLGELARDEAVVSMKAEITANSHPTMEQRIQVGQLVKKLLDRRRDKIAGELLAALQTKYSNVAVNPRKDDSMVLNAAVLIDRDEEGQFDQTIGELDGHYRNQINFRCVGPLPPYSFATAEVKMIGVSELNAAREALELDGSASLAEIKASHRRLLRQHHPDRNPDPGADDRIREISAAYELLEEYALNFKHTLDGSAEIGRAIVEIKSLGELREKLAAQAA